MKALIKSAILFAPFSLMTLSAVCSMPAAALETPDAREGGSTVGNGGFAYQVSYSLLQESARALARLLPQLSAASFDAIASQPNYRDRLLSLITYENLLLLPEQDRSRGGRPLQMDYLDGKVAVLRPFFATYSGTSANDRVAAIYGIQHSLIHEAAHLFGLAEAEALRFADQVITDIRRRGDSSVVPPSTEELARRLLELTTERHLVGEYVRQKRGESCPFHVRYLGGTRIQVISGLDQGRLLVRYEGSSFGGGESRSCASMRGLSMTFTCENNMDCTSTTGAFMGVYYNEIQNRTSFSIQGPGSGQFLGVYFGLQQ